MLIKLSQVENMIHAKTYDRVYHVAYKQIVQGTYLTPFNDTYSQLVDPVETRLGKLEQPTRVLKESLC